MLEPWKVEHDSLTEQLYCYAISAKRYALYRHGPGNRPQILETRDTDDTPSDEGADEADPLADWSEHGLGLYLDPTGDSVEKPARDDDGRRIWIRETWEWILANAHGQPRKQPAWATRYALTRFTVSNPGLANWFAGYNRYKPREQQVRPGSFGLIAHPTAAFDTEAKPTTTYESKPERWGQLEWYDRATAKPLTITTVQARSDPDAFAATVQGGAVVIDTLAQALGRYARRPEHKSLAPDGQPATGETQGLLERRPITGHPVSTVLTGKEGNKITERLTGEIAGVADYRNDYGTRTDIWSLVAQVLPHVGAPAIIDRGIPRSTAFSALKGARPREREATYLAIVCDHATPSLEGWGLDAPTEPLAQLTAYLRERDKLGGGVRRCGWCGKPLEPNARSDARYHSAACRKAAQRATKA